MTKTTAEGGYSALAPLRNDPDRDPSLISLYTEMSRASRAVDSRSVTVQPPCFIANQHRRTQMTQTREMHDCLSVCLCVRVFLSLSVSLSDSLRPSVGLCLSVVPSVCFSVCLCLMSLSLSVGLSRQFVSVHQLIATVCLNSTQKKCHYFPASLCGQGHSNRFCFP